MVLLLSCLLVNIGQAFLWCLDKGRGATVPVPVSFLQLGALTSQRLAPVPGVTETLGWIPALWSLEWVWSSGREGESLFPTP